MYDSIFVPVDLSETNDAVLDRAVRMGDPEATTVTLLHVIETVEDIPVEEDEEFYADLRENAEAKMEKWAAQLADAGYDVTVEILYGKRGQEIVRLARERDIDLIVLRSHIVNPEESREQMGTVSHQIALFAPCSVLMVRE